MWNQMPWALGIWDAESYPSPSELWFVFAFAAVFPSVRFILDSFIFEKVGRHFIFKKARAIASGQQRAEEERAPLLKPEVNSANGGLANGVVANGIASTHAGNGGSEQVNSVEAIDRHALEKTLVKFKESCWKACYYSSALAFATWAAAGEPWLGNTEYYFKGPGDLVWPDQTMKLKLKGLFLYEGGFYTYSIFALLFWETRRKDFVVSMVHHVISSCLAMFAFIFRFGRPLCLVVAIHDTSDVFLELAKVHKYLEIEVVASIMFVLFAASWAWLRLWCYPRYVIYASSVVAPRVIELRKLGYGGPSLYYFFNWILILLLVLHVYWWILILRVLIKQIVVKEVSDVRSEDEEDGDD